MEDQEYLLRKYATEFGACDELREFAIDHRPTPKSTEPVAHLILWTAARSHRTFKVVVKLCKLGYAEQATMLNRSLFEDMVIAHWAHLNPENSGERITEHDELAATMNAEVFEKHGVPLPEGHRPKLSGERRRLLRKKFGARSRPWTGKWMHEMVEDIKGMWGSEFDQRLLEQLHAFGYRTSTTLLHHSAHSISQGVRYSNEQVVFDVGPSERLVEGTLGIAFWTYGQTLSLVLEGESLATLEALSQKHSRLYIASRGHEQDAA
jgi:hypothetical protein